MYSLTKAEVEIIQKGLASPDSLPLFTNYWFNKGDNTGFEYDKGFEEEWRWQYKLVFARQPLIVAIAGIGCSDIDSNIYDADLKKYVTFRWLIENKRNPVVLSRTATGWKKVQASEPYLKGQGEMLRVTLSDGNTLDVSVEHKLLTTNQGYAHTRDLRIGDTLVAPRNLSSIEGSESEDVLLDLGIDIDCQDRYSFHLDQCDEPPQDQLEGVQAFLPLQGDVEQPNHLISSDQDSLVVQERRHMHRLSDLDTDHRQMQRSAPLLVLRNEKGLSHRYHEATYAPPRSCLPLNNPVRHQSYDNSSQYWRDVLAEEHIDLGVKAFYDDEQDQIQWTYDASLSCKKELAALLRDVEQQQSEFQTDPLAFEVLPDPFESPCGDFYNYYTPVVTKIESLGIRDLYDIHVPLWNNYVMDGVVSHNTGKTLGVGMAGVTWCISTEGFRFMNGANWAYQAKLMYDLILSQITDTPTEKLIDKAIESPYPKIVFKFKIGQSTYTSTMEFMSMDRNAQKIFSWRGDWINLDEAALIGDLDIAMMNLSTRLTGNTPRGREYLGRMSLMSNPWDNDSSAQLYYFFDMAIDEPDECLSITLPTRANKNVSDRQVKNALRYISADDQGRLLDGDRPEGKGLYFSKNTVVQCADPYYSQWIEDKIKTGAPGFSAIRVPTIGVVQYETIPNSNTLIMVGDPGTDCFPARNSPVIAILDTKDLPDGPAKIVSFWWGNGAGRISTFTDKLMAWKDKYNPYFVGIDSTGPQAGMVEMLNLTNFYDSDMKSFRGGIAGMDFSGGRKPQFLVALRILLEAGLMVWPDFAKGIKSQLVNYDPSKDRVGAPKIAQDIVATLAMAAFVIRSYYRIDPKDAVGTGSIVLPDRNAFSRYQRHPEESRNFRRN